MFSGLLKMLVGPSNYFHSARKPQEGKVSTGELTFVGVLFILLSTLASVSEHHFVFHSHQDQSILTNVYSGSYHECHFTAT